ncbi:hypothetical protein E4T49_03235 [Aureobasidium sp. EXF-10728]|nr:hypothetical protein E4T49_03235 [Aureobasidium sp. EXF-10728]
MPSVTDYKAYHILSYGSFLGATLFQSFIGGVVAFKVLPRAQFSTLQKATFPVFFALQSALGLALMVTYPGEKLLGVGGQYIRENTGFSGLVLNSLIIGPATTKTMKERHHQETRDGKKYSDAGPHTKAMEQLNKTFGILHSVSTIINLTAFGCAIWYGFVLEYPAGDKFDLEYKTFFEKFYETSDTPTAHEEYSKQFTQNATLIMASKKVQGREEILSLRKGMWEKVDRRKHTALKVFPFGPNSNEVMLYGTVEYGLKDGREATVDWAARAHLVKQDDAVMMDFYQVYLDTAAQNPSK